VDLKVNNPKARHRRRTIAILGALICLYLQAPLVQAQRPTNPDWTQAQQGTNGAESELQIGTQLTRSGRFQEAIPHLLAARGSVSNEYAVEFNLALCYVAIHQSSRAVPILAKLRRTHDDAQVENLLAQAYVGAGDSKSALDAVQRAAGLTPGDEKLYLFIADSCTESQNYGLGLDVVNLGLRHLPNSAGLHYQRAMFLSSIDQFDAARPDFALAAKLGTGSDIGYLAAAEENLFAGKIEDAVRAAREGINSGRENYRLLTILGDGLLRLGIAPDQPQFAEAQDALSRAVSIRPDYSDAQLALGKLDLISHRLDEAIGHLEQARALDSRNPAIYSNLASAYREHGDSQKAQQMLAALAQINREQLEKISSAPGERKPVAGASSANRREVPKD